MSFLLYVREVSKSLVFPYVNQMRSEMGQGVNVSF